MGKYDDIINLPHYQSKTRAHMPMRDRAAQFAPFAALTGYGDEINEAGRLTDSRIELAEGEKQAIDKCLQAIERNITDSPEVTITYFAKDELKSGGSYQTVTGRVRSVDSIAQRITLRSGDRIEFENIYTIEFPAETEFEE